MTVGVPHEGPGPYPPPATLMPSAPLGFTAPMALGETSPADPALTESLRSRARPLLRAVPPPRLAWMSLLIVGLYSSQYLHWVGLAPLALVPLVSFLSDLGFQRVRFSHLRFPDAALTTGLLIALVLPPTAPLALLAALGFSAVTLRHALRSHGHPWFNSAAVAMLAGAALFGLAPSWWVGIGPYGEALMVGLGLLVVARSVPSRTVVAVFVAAYGFISVVEHLTVGATTDPHILLLQVLDPATLFFALFIVSEPRSALGARPEQFVYGGVVGIAAALLPILFPSIGILIALVGANLVAVAFRHSEAPAHSRALAESPRPRRTASTRPTPAPSRRWPIGYRAGAGFFALVVLIAVVGASPASSSVAPIVHISPPGGGGGGGSSASQCASDNPSIPAGTLGRLHQILGPSVILSFDSTTGVVVFYDPSNQVTVTETDLYEDYGFAEFNGDDYAVTGCAP